MYTIHIYINITYYYINIHHAGQSCGGFIQLTKTTDYGHLISPQFPENYPNNTHCIWLI